MGDELMNAYTLRAMYQDEPSAPMLLTTLDDRLELRLKKRTGPFRLALIKNGVATDPGPWRTVDEGMPYWIGTLANAKPGQNYRMENKRSWKIWIYVRQASKGLQIIGAAKTQLGVPYVFGSMDPDTDGPGPDKGEFDCSGLTKWCYQSVGVYLPHSADMQMNDSRMRFTSSPQQGDLVFFNFGRLSAGHADHVGLWYRPGFVIDTRNPDGEPVAYRPIETENVLHIGYIKGVTH